MKTINTPPTTLNVANALRGKTTSYVLSTNIKGAQRNHARAQTVDENIRIFFRSAATSSAVHTVNTHIPIDVAVLIANVGAISNATTCVSFTVKNEFISKKN